MISLDEYLKFHKKLKRMYYHAFLGIISGRIDNHPCMLVVDLLMMMPSHIERMLVLPQTMTGFFLKKSFLLAFIFITITSCAGTDRVMLPFTHMQCVTTWELHVPMLRFCAFNLVAFTDNMLLFCRESFAGFLVGEALLPWSNSNQQQPSSEQTVARLSKNISDWMDLLTFGQPFPSLEVLSSRADVNHWPPCGTL